MELQDMPLPDWALGLNQAKDLDIGTQLLTKDGRRVGNARIEAILKTDEPMAYLVRTDIGNTITMYTDEIYELFYIGDYFIKNQGDHNGRNTQRHHPHRRDRAHPDASRHRL